MPVIERITTTSIQEFLKKFKAKNYQDPITALKESMGYLAKYYVDVTHKSLNNDLNDIAYTIKNEIAKIVAKKQIESNDQDYKDMHDKENENLLKSLFSEPLETMSYFIETHKKDIVATIDDKEYQMYLDFNYEAIQKKLLSQKTKFQKLDNDNSFNQAYNTLASIESKLPLGKNSIENSFKNQKPGFFEKIFRRTSNEYKAFVNSFNAYKDKQNPTYGENSYLKISAMNYLKHKFPNLKDDELPTIEQINALGGAGKERASFCLNVIKSIDEIDVLQERANDIVRDVKNTKVDYPFKIEQEEFQKSLLKETLEKEALESNKQNENEYDPKYDQIEVHDKQNMFN